MQWFANIIALSLSTVPVMAFSAYADPASDVQQGAAAAAASGTTMSSYAGSGPALSNNLVTPLINASKITTADGQTTFTTNSFQSSGSPLILVTLNPDPASGDLKNIIIQQDLTGAGTLNYAQAFPISGDGPGGPEIAGVCQNGYIQCNQGFTNCQYRTWTAGPNGAVSAAAVGNVGDLSGCYCFDNYCTGANNSLLEQSNIASDAGSGIISAFLTANTGVAISNATSGISPSGSVVLTYYGYRPSTLSNGSNTSTMTTAEIAAMPVMSTTDTQTPQTYYADSANLNNLSQNALTAQKAAPNSIYNIVMNAASSQTGTTVNCTNSIEPSLASITLTQSQSGTTNLAIDDHFTWSFVETSPYNFVLTGVDNKGNPFPPTSYTFQPSNTLGGFELQSVSFTGSWPNGSGGCGGYSFNPTWTPGDGTTAITGATPGGVCGSPGYQYPVMNWTFSAQYVTQQEQDVTSLGCAQYENNPTCTLQQDTWDGRPVVVNGMVMNNQQLGQMCKTLPGVGTLPAVTVCKPWFVQNRTFFCKNPTTYNFSTAEADDAAIENSTTMPTNSSMQYSDPTRGDITVTYGTPAAGALPNCSQVCETKIPSTQTSVVYTSTPQSSNQTAATQSASLFFFFYKDCANDGSGNFTCPTDTTKGEVVVTQCGCSADMGQALGGLNAAGSSAQDAICSAN